MAVCTEATGKSPWAKPLVLGAVPVPRPLFYAAIGIPLALALNWMMCGMLGFATNLLFHETGHAAIAIFFGHPAVPSAAGVCHIFDRSILFAFMVWAGMAAAAWFFRDKPLVAGLIGACVLVSVVVGFTGLPETLILLAGHGGEVAFACIFIWRALQGGLFNEFERPLYAMLGWYLLGSNASMFWKLRTSPDFRAEYSSQSFTDGPNDFEAVAEIHDVSIEAVGTLMLVLSLAAAVVVISAWLYLSLTGERPRLHKTSCK